MAVILIYPAVAALAMFIVGVIIVMLRFGPQLCHLRHHTLPDDHNEWRSDDRVWRGEAYDHEISLA